MIVYFADRTLDIVGTASTTLPEGLRIVSDEKKEDVDSGIKTFNCSIAYDDKSRKAVTDAMKVGNFLLRSHNDENEFYTIIESENNTEAREVSVYAEDAGLDLINTVVDAYSAESNMTIAQYLDLWLPDGWEIGLNESADSLKLEWTSEQTLTERLKELASAFGCELNYSYEIDRLTISARYINVYKKRGQQNATEQLMLGRDVDSVVVRSSVANLATAYNVTGGTPEGKKNPINLNGCDYSSDGETFHSPSVATDDYQIIGKKVVCMSAKTKWASALDEDGLLVRNFSFDTTDKPTLFMQAVKSLMEVKDGEVNYDINLVSLPEGVRLGDRINIVDDADEIYLEGRILELTTSVVSNSVTAVFGDYLIKDSGISEQLQELARRIARESAVSASNIAISSTNGLTFKNTNINTTLVATIYYAGQVIDSNAELIEVYGSGAVVKWYRGSTELGSGFQYSLSTSAMTDTIICKLIVGENIASTEITLQQVDDGYSPSASVNKSGSTATITITDKQGTTTANVTDGTNGRSLNSTVRYYRIATSTPSRPTDGSAIPSGWSSTEPSYSASGNLYIVDQYNWSSGTTPTYSAVSLSSSYTAAQYAVQSANGKNTIYHQTSQPSGGTYKTGDTWFDTDDGYKMYTYNGSSWVAEQFNTNAIANSCITNAKIADATIQNAKIATLDAGKITTGTLDANRIAANSLTIGKMASDVTTSISNASTAYQQCVVIDGNGVKVRNSSYPNNAIRMASDGIEFYKGGQSVAYYTDASIELGRNNTDSVIKMSGGAVWVKANGSSRDGSIAANDTLVLGAYDSNDTTFSGISFSRGENQNPSIIMMSVVDDNGSCEATLNKRGLTVEGYFKGNGLEIPSHLKVSSIGSGSGTTCVYNSDGYIVKSSSSSRRYKKDIKPVETEQLNPRNLYNLEVIQFKYNGGYLVEGDENEGKDIIGFIAEDVEEVMPAAVVHDEDGRAEMWNERVMIPAMLKLIQEQHEEIETLKARVTALERG